MRERRSSARDEGERERKVGNRDTPDSAIFLWKLTAGFRKIENFSQIEQLNFHKVRGSSWGEKGGGFPFDLSKAESLSR